MSNEIKDWVLVPREPDGDMLDAAIDAHIYFDGEDEVDAVWAAMLAAAPTPPAEAQVADGGELAKLLGKWREHSKVDPAAAGRLMRDLATELEAALSAQARPIPAVDEEMVRRGCEALAKRWRSGVPVGPTATEDVRAVLAAALLAPQPASAPVGVDGPVIGWLHEIEYADGWGGPRFVMGAEKPKAHLEQVRHPELIAPTIKGERFTPLTAALAQQPAAVDEAPTYRLLSSADEIRADDEFLGDDTVTWLPVGKEFLSASMCGKKYNPAFLQPMRRAIAALAQPQGEG